MDRFTLCLLLQVSLSQAAAIWLQSSRIEFPSTQIGPLESPFKEFNRASQPSKLEQFTSFKKHQQRRAYPVVKFPERDTEEKETVLPTRERGEFDSLVHFPPKSGVEDPIRGNKSKIGRRTKTETRRTKVQLVDKESGCLERSIIAGRRRRCRKTKKILRPQYSIFA